MKKLRFVVKAKEMITFQSGSISFVRGSQETKPLNISYSNGNGYTLADGTTLLTEGTTTIQNFLSIVVDGNQTLTGTGVLNLLITRFPNGTQSADMRTLTIDGSQLIINFNFSSKPVATDMEIEVDNRTNKVVTLAHFIPYVTDYDGVDIAYITIYNADSNLKYNGSPYINGTPISANDIANGLLVYHPDDTDLQYNDDYDYTVTDSQGNISD